MSSLHIQNIHAAYGESKVLHDVSLDVPKGQAVTLLGRNGAGKTTTIRSVCGLLKPTQGRILFGDTDITQRRPDEIVRDHGIVEVTEYRGIFTHLSVCEYLYMIRSS